MLTIADLNSMTARSAYEGFGYLGERSIMLTSTEMDHDIAADMVAEADMKAIDEANRLGYTLDQLFDWANSKTGRWYGDCMFGANGKHADKYLPGKRGH